MLAARWRESRRKEKEVTVENIAWRRTFAMMNRGKRSINKHSLLFISGEVF